MNVLELLKQVFDGIERTLDVNSVIGATIIHNGYSVVPISKMSVGFGSGGGEIEGKNIHKTKDSPIGAIGGGATISPLGFLVMGENEVKFLKVSASDGINECLETILENVLK
ncbi:MAG: hypothetical protein IJ676_01025 [Clostridia bacterium]|nr:hypothetical protein [Clostridia bacterium]